MSSPSTARVLGTLITAAALTLAWGEWKANVRLQAEIDALRSQATDASALRRENADLRRQAAALAAKRAETPPPAPGRRPVRSVPLDAHLRPIDGLPHGSLATPRDAFAAQLWGAKNGDIELEAGTLALDSAARALLQKVLDGLPAEWRATYDTPEKLMAFALAGSPHPVGGMQVLGEVRQGPDDVTLHTRWQHEDDDIVHDSDAQFHQDGGTWKWVVPLPLVQRAAAYLSRQAVQPPPRT